MEERQECEEVGLDKVRTISTLVSMLTKWKVNGGN